VTAPDAAEIAVLQGEIPAEGIVSLLTEIEASCATGALVFEVDGEPWEVVLVAGQIATDQPERADGEDAFERLLELRAGTYWVYQRLPPLPVSSGGATRREGSLAVHVPADLMNYCERAGLSGQLTFEAKGQRAEILYEGGELSTIRLDGVEDLNDVFAWEEGSFRIDAKTLADVASTKLLHESLPAPPRPASEPPLLGIVEVALASILREREERRPGSRTGPLMPSLPLPRAGDTLPPPTHRPRGPRRDATVKVIYLGGAPAARSLTDTSTRHVRDDVTAEMVLPEATRGRVTPEPSLPRENIAAPKGVREGEGSGEIAMAAADATTPDGVLHLNKPEDDFSPGTTFLWILVVLVVAVAMLALLAQLPPLE